MKAVSIHRHGGPEALEYGDVPTPTPGAGEVLVRLRAAGLNHADIAVREGWAHFGTPLPMILGVEGAGEVAALGSGVTGVAVGTRVVLDPLLNCGHCRYCRLGRESSCLDYRAPGEHRDGTYAEYIAMPAANVVPLPNHISFEAAAVSVVAFCTAWHLLITRGHLQAGETILIVGAGGGVASAGVQIARLVGARVIATTSTAEKVARLRELGADEVINYRATPDFDVVVRELTSGEGVDAVQDNVGLATFQKSLNSLRKWGRLLGVGSHTGTNVQVKLWQIYSRELEVIGSHQWTHAEVQTVLNLVFQERLRPIVDRVFSLSQAAEAHRVLDTGAQFGKLVLTM